MILGLTGITLTPAMSSRVFKAAPNTSLINTMHTSVICLGVVIGSWAGGYAIDQGYGYRAPTLIGIFSRIGDCHPTPCFEKQPLRYSCC